MFVDTHCHMNIMVEKKPEEPLRSAHFDTIDEIVQNATQAQVSKIINVGTSLSETYNVCQIASQYEHVYATAGIHPCDCSKSWKRDFEKMSQLVTDHVGHKIVAIGETGLDYYHTPYDADRQHEAFRAHIELALRYDLPLVVHIRDAGDDALKVLNAYRSHGLRGVIHCFSLDLASARSVVEWGWYIGIDGPVSYPKNDWLREVVTHVPLEHILLETDAPFLTPQAIRGKRNAPAYLPLIAQVVAQCKKMAIEEVAQQTTMNANSLFSI